MEDDDLEAYNSGMGNVTQKFMEISKNIRDVEDSFIKAAYSDTAHMIRKLQESERIKLSLV